MTRTHSRRNSLLGAAMAISLGLIGLGSVAQATEPITKIGRASCRERV